jgi:[protein-PII] uridylyltransferase
VFQQPVRLQGLSARTLRALYTARDLIDAKFRRDPVNRATFMQILKAPSGQTHAFRLMNQTRVLGRYLWVFRRIVGQMQHDLFHVYTVDQHIIMVVRNVRRFFIPEHAHEYPFCSQLAAGFDRPYVLYVAALFHDIAKGRGGDHSELGAREVRQFLAILVALPLHSDLPGQVRRDQHHEAALGCVGDAQADQQGEVAAVAM